MIRKEKDSYVYNRLGQLQKDYLPQDRDDANDTEQWKYVGQNTRMGCLSIIS